ncbi:hypothetical protein B0H15DRAFT_794823 [Mycena belliarum]|uniref:Uncharacterized protein n=1 Tax=Mycena belliarum TaxID=1033014 RepID=A0AAD6TL55_9AGAR|nr:hypothetical protein B0H15DRAFT_794823 [Mycena belliae]
MKPAAKTQEAAGKATGSKEGGEESAQAAEGAAVAPDWAKDSFASLVALDGGPAWRALCNAWWEVEAGSRFTAGKALRTKGRPEQVGWWIGRGRARAPTITNVDAFAASWNKWWRSLNPTWRSGEKGGELSREAGGDWDVLRVPGINGMLSVVMSLKWWGDKVNADGVEVGDWARAVDDVLWALGELGGGDVTLSRPAMGPSSAVDA